MSKITAYFSTTCLLALFLAGSMFTMPDSEAGEVQFKVFNGDGHCAPGYRLASLNEAQHNMAKIKLAPGLGQWTIARLACGGSQDGQGYHFNNRAMDSRTLGDSLCVQGNNPVLCGSKPDIAKKGAWSYGWGGDDMTFNTFPSQGVRVNGKVKALYKKSWWSVAQNITNKDVTDDQHITYPANSKGALVLHPGPGNSRVGTAQRTKVRYTAITPATYTFTFTAKQVDKDASIASKHRSVLVVVRANNGYTTEYKITNGTELKMAPQKYTLKAGESVMLEVDNDGDWTDDSTLVTFNVSY